MPLTSRRGCTPPLTPIPITSSIPEAKFLYKSWGRDSGGPNGFYIEVVGMQGLPLGLTLPEGRQKRGYNELRPLLMESSTHFPPKPFPRPPSEQQEPGAWGTLAAPDFSKQLSYLPQVSARLPSSRQWPPLLGVMSAPPRPPQEHCGQIWRTQQCLGAGTDWGGGGAAAPGRPLAAGEGEGSPGVGRKDESRREAGPPSLPSLLSLVPSAGSQAHARLTF